eukprot:8331843-Prorocentrum_lima.AAC.1
MQIAWGTVVDLENLDVLPADGILFYEYEDASHWYWALDGFRLHTRVGEPMGVRVVSTAIAAPFPGAEWTTDCIGFATNIEQAGGQKLTILA